MDKHARGQGGFVDEARIHVKGGDGGAGSAAFRREAHVPKGGPAGGDGGKGGDVILEADPGISTLLEYAYRRHHRAMRGTHGKGAHRDGAAGEDLVLRVPVGTIVRDDDTGEIIADLSVPGQRVVVARGGRGGRGNTHFVTPTRRAPTFAELGEPGEERWITLELKLLADAALVGLPSVGKSSIIARISAARPKIADYPFTTLVPNLGVVDAGERSFVVADVPGLIEGASEGAGLGHGFLRHIERSALIMHVVDLSGSYEGRDPVDDIVVIDRELAAHAKELSDRPQVVVGNKIDLPGSRENSKRVAAWCEEAGRPYFAISAATGEGVQEMLRAVAERVHELREQAKEVSVVPPAVYVYEPPSERIVEVVREAPGEYRVRGGRIERMVIMTEMLNDEAVAYLQRRLQRAGVEQALRDAGAKPGDTVHIGPVSFEFEVPSDDSGSDGEDDG